MTEEKKTLNERMKELAEAILVKVSYDEEDDAKKETPGVASAEGNAPEPGTEGEEGAEAAQPSVSNEAVVEILEKVSSKLDERDEQVNALAETVRLLIQASPAKETPQSAQGSAGKSSTSLDESPIKQLNLRR